MRYLSDEWFVAANEALAGDVGLKEVLADVVLKLEQTVDGVPDFPEGRLTWQLVIDHGSARLLVGSEGPAPDIRFRTTYQVACDIAQGVRAAPAAFIAGDLSVGGDLSLLSTHQRAFSTVDDVLREVRAATSFQ